MKDESNVSKMEGKTNFSRRLKQFDGLTWLIPTPLFYVTVDMHMYDARMPLNQYLLRTFRQSAEYIILPSRRRVDS